MVRINHTLMRRSRVKLGWNAEKLAEEAGLDPRTIRRIEQGVSRTRLRSAIAIADALELDLGTFVLDDPLNRDESEGNEVGLKTAFAAVDPTTQRELVYTDERILKGALYVSSMLLADSLILDRRVSGENDNGTDRVVAAFKAADSVIQAMLSVGGEWGAEEATCVLSSLLARYGTAFSRGAANDVEVGASFVQAVCDQAKRALPQDVARK